MNSWNNAMNDVKENIHRHPLGFANTKPTISANKIPIVIEN
jgi:hypothetical protein